MHKPVSILGKIKWRLFQLLPGSWLLVKMPTNKKAISLTFDDGPNPQVTPLILQVLQEFDIKATFFLVGDMINKHPDIAKAIVEQGHSVGNHSMHHKQFHALPLESQLSEIEQCEKLLSHLDNHDKHYFRPPQGFLNVPLFLAMLKKRLTIAMWSVNSLDYKYHDAEQLVGKFKDDSVQSGDVILFHDDGMHTYESLQVLIPKWQQLGFQFVDCAVQD